MRFIAGVAAIALLGICGACKPKAPNPKTSSEVVAPAVAAAEAVAAAPDVAKIQHIDSARAMKYVRDIVQLGPRPVGSEAHHRAETYIIARLKTAGAQVESDNFTAQTPVGPIGMRNIIAKFPGKKDGIVVITSHYDTLYGRKDFVGANDGGSSTGLLLELGNEFARERQRAGYSVWLVFFDGEEAIKEWQGTDNDYGSRHLAEKWQQDGTLKKIKALFLLDMIGDADLNIDRDQNSAPWLEDVIYKSAGELGYQSYFFGRETTVDDDHTPFVQRNVPCADLIDFNYGYNNVFWHSPQDTLDKLSAHSLQVVGDVTMGAVQLVDQR